MIFGSSKVRRGQILGEGLAFILVFTVSVSLLFLLIESKRAVEQREKYRKQERIRLIQSTLLGS